MPSTQIVILYNETETLLKGESLDLLAERGVLKAVDAVEESLSQLNFTPIRLPIKERSFSFLNRLRQLKPSLVFNLCEGLYGESELEATIPGMLEILQIPYTGNRALTLSLCLRKDFCKSILARHRVPTARFQIMRHLQEPLARSLTFPLIVKPSKEDASLGITNASVVYNESELSTQVGYIWERYQQPALVEEFIDGREFNISILGDDPPEV
ncbi:MAG: hypothetical protein HY731_12765, partial [Candidatus Tectomicrobia bacterium]|nr:hypothetical protein [Candidatus Tectomicrobia bacterium]